MNRLPFSALRNDASGAASCKRRFEGTKGMFIPKIRKCAWLGATVFAAGLGTLVMQGQNARGNLEGERLFEKETFAGNGRTCLTCHTRETGTISPQDAQKRFLANRHDPLFAHDGSDDGRGNGVRRMLTEATVLVEIPLPPNVSLAADPQARSVVVRRGIPTTLNTPALDRVLMMDGREPDLPTQAGNAIRNHAQSTRFLKDSELLAIANFELTDRFFSSAALRDFARGGKPPALPPGRTDSEIRGRRFFDDVPPIDGKMGLCAGCHSGPMLDRTNQFLPFPLPPGSRFQTVIVSELNEAHNPVHEFIFRNKDGSTSRIKSPDPGRALITGDAQSPLGDSVNAFKIPSLWGVRRTAPYFHDNSARTLEDVMAHYAKFFEIVTRPSGGGPPQIVLTPQDQADIVAYLKLLD